MTEAAGVPVVEVARLAARGDVSLQPALALEDARGGSARERATTVRFGATAEEFVIQFDTVSEPPLHVRHRDGEDVFFDECVEVFLASPSDPFTYGELVVNPRGAVYTARIVNAGESRATWTVTRGGRPEGISVAVSGEPASRPAAEWARWRCELFVPWSILPSGRSPAPGEERRGNAYRIARGRSTAFLALSPTLRANPPDFHVPSRFARFVFGAGRG